MCVKKGSTFSTVINNNCGESATFKNLKCWLRYPTVSVTVPLNNHPVYKLDQNSPPPCIQPFGTTL